MGSNEIYLAFGRLFEHVEWFMQSLVRKIHANILASDYNNSLNQGYWQAQARRLCKVCFFPDVISTVYQIRNYYKL